MQKKNYTVSKLHIRAGDTVKVLAGNARNKQGEVVQVFPKAYRAIVRGVNLVTKHVKPSAQNPKGGIIKKEASLHLSNLMLVDPAANTATRVGRKKNEQGKLVRYAKKTGKIIDND